MGSIGEIEKLEVDILKEKEHVERARQVYHGARNRGKVEIARLKEMLIQKEQLELQQHRTKNDVWREGDNQKLTAEWTANKLGYAQIAQDPTAANRVRNAYSKSNPSVPPPGIDFIQQIAREIHIGLRDTPNSTVRWLREYALPQHRNHPRTKNLNAAAYEYPSYTSRTGNNSLESSRDKRSSDNIASRVLENSRSTSRRRTIEFDEFDDNPRPKIDQGRITKRQLESDFGERVGRTAATQAVPAAEAPYFSSGHERARENGRSPVGTQASAKVGSFENPVLIDGEDDDFQDTSPRSWQGSQSTTIVVDDSLVISPRVGLLQKRKRRNVGEDIGDYNAPGWKEKTVKPMQKRRRPEPGAMEADYPPDLRKILLALEKERCL